MWWPDPGAVALRDAEGALELGAASEQRPARGDRHRDRLGHVAARAPQGQRPGADSRVQRAQDRIVGAGLDRAIVDEEGVGDPVEPLQRVRVAVGDRLVGDVAGGQHQGSADVGREQMVKRRRRQHHAEVGASRRDPRGDGRIAAPASDHDRSPGVGEQGLLGGRQLDQLTGGAEVGGEQRERLRLSVLACAQGADRALVGGEAGEVVSADPLDGDDDAGAQQPRRRLDRIAITGVSRQVRAARVDQPHRGAALRAGVGLGVEAAVARVLVLGAAARAHLEPGHRRPRTVVGDAADDREPGSAVGAVGERIPMAAVGRVGDLGQAALARRRVGRDQRRRLAASARADDPEPVVARRRQRLGGDLVDRGQRGRLGRQPGEQLVDRPGVALDLELHPALVVEHPPAQPELLREPEDVGPEADALDHARDPGAYPPSRVGSRRRRHQRAPVSISSRSTW